MRLVLLLAPAVLLASCASGAALPGDELPLPAIPWAPRGYVCHRAATPPAIDGRLDEPSWRAAASTETFVDIEGPSRAPPRFATRAKLLWDDRCLYVAAEMEEPDVSGFLTERDSVIFRDNDFEVFLDPDGDGKDYFEIEVNALGTVWDLTVDRPYREGGAGNDAWNAHGLACAVRVDGTTNLPADRDRGWTLEMAIPWADLAAHAGRPVPPAPGDRWRLNFSRVQWGYATGLGRYEKLRDPATGEPLPEDNWVWSPQGLVSMHYPEMWGFLQFSGQDAGAGGEPLRSPSAAERAPYDRLVRRTRPGAGR